jgi:hypothetical protein
MSELREWHPIGGGDVPEGQDEYDSYLGPIAERLRSGQTPEELAGYLNDLTEEWMGLGGPQRPNPPHREANLAAARVSFLRATGSPCSRSDLGLRLGHQRVEQGQ